MKTYLAKCNIVPSEGVVMRNYWRLSSKGEWEFMRHSSTVEKVCLLSDGIYAVRTLNTTYLVQVVD